MIELYHSVLRYVPDTAREEFLNIGVLVTCPDLGFAHFRLNMKMKSRLQCIDAGFEPFELDLFDSVLSRRMGELKTATHSAYARTHRPSANGAGAGVLRLEGTPVEVVLQGFVRDFAAGRFQLSPFRLTEARGDQAERHDVENLLDALYARLVLPRPAEEPFGVEEVEIDRDPFEATLERYKLLDDQGRTGLQKNFRLDRLPEVRFSYGYQNGSTHVLERITLGARRRPDSHFNEVGGAFMKFVSAREVIDQRLHAYVVLSGAESEVTYLRRSINTLEQQARIVHADNPDELNHLMVGLGKAMKLGRP